MAMAAREDGAVPWSRRAGIWSAALFGAGLLFARTVDAGAPWWWFGAAGAMGLLALIRPARWGGWALCGALLA
ncbi:MAG: hypothetical protein IBJ10_09145, partial [Phycisphaerales bacterium]|nr:hypothetical protein [Phycisphaerales bacterium]